MNREPLNSSTPFAVVVNDDVTQLNMLSGLVRKAGLEPRAFTGAEAALADMSACAGTADRNPGTLPALLVTDLYMPGIDGWRFCRLLRSPEYAAFNQVPILVVSATFAGDEASRIAADLGAEVFLPSPVEGKRFVEQVQAIMKGRRTRNLLRVLIVEDSKTLAGILKKAFETNGYQADTALTVREAADAFKKIAYDVAVLDYHLPDGTGDALLDEFHAMRFDCACLMMTTDPGPELALDWMKRGAAAYLRKPFEPDYLIELCARVRREHALMRVQDLLEVRTRELRESDARNKALLNALPDMMFLLNNDGVFLDYHAPSDTGLAVAPEFFLRRHIHDVLPASIADVTMSHIKDIIEKGESSPYVYEAEIAGEIRFYESRMVACTETNVLAIVRDITDRKRADEKLRESEEKFSKAFQTSPYAITITGAEDGAFVEVNDAFTSMTGVTQAEALAATSGGLMLWVNEEDRMHVVAALRACRTVVAQEYLFRMKSGKVITGLFSAQTIQLNNETCILSSILDITERKRVVGEKAKLEAQLHQAQKMESVGRLAGGVAHDFNNMLGVILGHAEIAMDQIDQALPIYADLEEIRKAAHRSADLTRQLLAFARKQTVVPKVLDLNETIEGMLKMLERLIGEDIHLNWQPKADLWPVKVDPSQIDQILANLLVNARDAIADTGRITIETGNIAIDEDYCADHPGFVPGEYVLLAVSDDGCGMDKETLAHIFEPFFTTKGVGKGTGLGLATVYGAVKQNNGFIDVYSEPGKGTTFTIYLPRHAGRAAQMRTEGAAAGPALRGHETVLLVEDEPAILKLTTEMLERQGYTVLAAPSPGKAISLVREHPGEIHLLMTDVVMPEMNGRDLAGNLLSIYPHFKILFMSGYTANVIAHHSVLDEGVYFIQKPFSMKNLAAKVREVLDQK